MEIMTLDSNFQPTGLVENYQSAIWTERYSRAGDFEIKSTDVLSLLTKLPLESYISLRESTVPMIVEAHKIEKAARAAPVLTVVGRSFETVLERRSANNAAFPGAAARTPWTIGAAKGSDAAYRAMRVVLGDVARIQGGVTVLPALSPVVAADAMPQISLTLPADYDPATTPNIYEIKLADLYTTAMELINAEHRGMKSVRSVGSNVVSIEIYNGADLTASVVFDAKFDQFDNATYLLSSQGSANVAYVFGPSGRERVLKTSAAEPTGFSRRVLTVDASGDTNVTSSDIIKSRGLIELYQNNVTALFDGQVAQQVAVGYNTRYFLGDIIKLNGEYGLSQSVRVSEYIRSSDSTGEKAFPTFETVS